MKLSYELLELDLEFPFTISRGSKSKSKTMMTKIEASHNGQSFTGLGEAVFSEFYGEDEHTVKAAYGELIRNGILMNLDLFNGQEFLRRVQSFAGNNAAKAGIDIALYDLRAKALGLPLYKFLGLDKNKAPRTSYTIGIASIEETELKVKTALERNYDILKVKLGTKEDLQILQKIRSLAPQATIRVDANAAWTLAEALELIQQIKSLGIEFVEEPLRLDSTEEEYKILYERSTLPLMADESCKKLDDISKCAKYFHMINLKLTKTGSLSEALRMIHAARALDLRIMLGCFTETNISISAMASISPLVDYADLDGSLLLKNDPFKNELFQGNKICLLDKPGIGIC
ncbi:MAG: dipeptide epimerase [Candidatus Caenarcaniphilales bacterium]|nr:dipeptide epimerase [Candidatus Caenarcaniphilales bacterium]